MPATIILGAQWGDEGKGRAVDYFSATADIAARATGGDNAGHTLNVGDHLLKLHLVPSGILHENVSCVLGNGMVINPISLVKEFDKLTAFGLNVTPERLKISTRAHLITPAHTALDAANEKKLGDSKIGTTLRGIGPAYADKVNRRGIRAGQMADPERFADVLDASLRQWSEQLVRDGFDALDVDHAVRNYVDAALKLRPFLTDTSVYLHEALKAEKHILCEGAQGAMLDIDFGSYPFVTSSSPTTGGTLSGLGFGAKYVQDVVGVAKAFSTRVGSGPMPTELSGPMAERLRGTGANFWDEFGTTTGRPRRVGWLDLVVLRYSAIINGFTKLVITKLDILSGIDELKLCTGYEIDGECIDYVPSTIEEVARALPVYETLPGWTEDVRHMRKLAELPANARRYIDRIEQVCETPIELISVGPERSQLVNYA